MSNPYESEKLLNEYLLFHYGSPPEILPHHPDGPENALEFPARIVGVIPESIRRAALSALDLGCAVGRSSFELSRLSDHVVGIDFSKQFIAAAESLRATGSLPYSRLDEAHQRTPLIARTPAGSHPDRIRFETGDAMTLRPDLGSFDLVLAANLLCRLSDPKRLLDRFATLVNPGGHLVLTTPCTWLAEFTPPENWPEQATLDWLDQHLGESFTRLDSRDLPFLIRETARKFQWTVAQWSLWQRRT